MDECKVGRTPWSAADAPVGLLLDFLKGLGRGPGGPRADQGARPTSMHERVRPMHPLTFYRSHGTIPLECLPRMNATSWSCCRARWTC